MAEVGHFSCVLLCLTETSRTMNDKNTKQAPKQITEWNSYFQKKSSTSNYLRNNSSQDKHTNKTK